MRSKTHLGAHRTPIYLSVQTEMPTTSTLKHDTKGLTVEDLIHSASPSKIPTPLKRSTHFPTPLSPLTTRHLPKAGAIHLTYREILHRPVTLNDLRIAHDLGTKALTETQRNDYFLKRQFLLDFHPHRILSRDAVGALSEREREMVREAAKERGRKEASVLRGQKRLQAIWNMEKLEIEEGRKGGEDSKPDDSTETIPKDIVGSENATLAAMSHPNWEHWSFPTLSPFSTFPSCPIQVALDDDDQEEGFVLVDNEDEEGWTKLSLDI